MSQSFIFYHNAFLAAETSLSERGVPTGAVLTIENNGKHRIIGIGRDQVITRHEIIECIESAGEIGLEEYNKCTLYTTVSPCAMCAGAILLFGIKRVVIGDTENIMVGSHKQLNLLTKAGVEVIVINDKATIKMVKMWNAGKKSRELI